MSSLDISEEEQDKIDDLLEYFPKVLSNDTVKEVVQGGPMIHLEDGMYRYAFAAHFRDAVIKAYKTSEYIGEEVLAYLQIPGGYIGCGDLDDRPPERPVSAIAAEGCHRCIDPEHGSV